MMHSLASSSRDRATGLQEVPWHSLTPQLWDKEHAFPFVKFLPSERDLQDLMQNQFRFHPSVLSPALLPFQHPPFSALLSSSRCLHKQQNPESPSGDLKHHSSISADPQHTWGEAFCLTKCHAGSPAGCQGMGGWQREAEARSGGVQTCASGF